MAKKKKKKEVTFKFIFLVLVVSILPMVLVGILVGNIGYRSACSAAQEGELEKAHAVAYDMAAYFERELELNGDVDYEMYADHSYVESLKDELDIDQTLLRAISDILLLLSVLMVVITKVLRWILQSGRRLRVVRITAVTRYT